MRQFRSLWKPISEEEYVAKWRRGMEGWNGWRYVILVIQVSVLIAVVPLAMQVVQRLMGAAAPFGNAPVNGIILGFVCGAIFGAGFGWFVQRTLHDLVIALGGFRSERLMLKYYDMLRAIAQSTDQDHSDIDETE